MVSQAPDYLTPYLDAAEKYHGGFRSLLWASPDTQAARFDAICRLTNLAGRSVLDLGCGRADFLDYLVARHIEPADYIGIEAVATLVEAARAKSHPHAQIIHADFVETPACMFVGADVVVISGALNTLDRGAFYSTIRRAFDAAAEEIVFNFLDSPLLAAASYLTWHSAGDVITFARTLSQDVHVLADYLDGDTTVLIRKNLATNFTNGHE
jgi:SAM-dependent methyltransferase